MSEASSTPTACSSSSSKYTHFTAKDSDSDSEVEEPGSGNPDDLEVVNSSKLTAVPDRNGVRFCRVCNEFLPIYAFPTGQRRYTCKTHLWMRVGIKAQKKLFAKPRKKLLSSIWNNCYKDGRRLARCLGLGARDLSPTLTQADIGSMLDAGAARPRPDIWERRESLLLNYGVQRRESLLLNYSVLVLNLVSSTLPCIRRPRPDIWELWTAGASHAGDSFSLRRYPYSRIPPLTRLSSLPLLTN